MCAGSTSVLRVVSVMLLIIVISTPLRGEGATPFGQESLNSLAQSHEWLSLLHADETGRSHINDTRFFLSGVVDDPLQELTALINNISVETIERFPARYLFIAQNLDLSIPFDQAPHLMEYLRKLNPSSISVLYASAYMGSPMSYFGHTVIQFKKANNPYFSQIFGFAAELPEGISSSALVVQGLSGRLPGTYIFAPFFLLAEQYLRTEQRYLIEYELSLTEYQVLLLSYHAYELSQVSFKYSFLTQNCTSELIPLLRVLDESIPFKNRPFGVVTPYDFIAAVEQSDGVKGPFFYHPSINRIYAVRQQMSPSERAIYHSVMRSGSRVEALTSVQNSSTRDEIAYLLSAGTDLRFRRFGIADTDYREIDQLVFSVPDVGRIQPYTPISRPMKVTTGIRQSDSGTEQTLGFRPFFFNRREDRPNLLSDASLEFLAVDFRTDYETIELEQLDILQIEVISTILLLFPYAVVAALHRITGTNSDGAT